MNGDRRLADHYRDALAAALARLAALDADANAPAKEDAGANRANRADRANSANSANSANGVDSANDANNANANATAHESSRDVGVEHAALCARLRVITIASCVLPLLGAIVFIVSFERVALAVGWMGGLACFLLRLERMARIATLERLIVLTRRERAKATSPIVRRGEEADADDCRVFRLRVDPVGGAGGVGVRAARRS